MIAIILGTRPEIIKMSPVIRECEKKSIDYFILHTGQHYSHLMDKVFFEQLKIPEAKYNLDVGSGMHGEQTGKMLAGIEKVLIIENPEVVIVQGDTNTVLAGAIAASKLHIKVGHVEAGLRSYDRNMPEEKIFMTGNTIVDAVYQNLNIKSSDVLKDIGLKDKGYILVTAHREENVDNPERFKDILEGINIVSEEFDLPVIYPMHPGSKKMVEKFGLRLKNINIIEPLDYLGFLHLEKGARLVLTDSGGVQEETCIMGVPCVTLRDNTERPETIEVGSNLLAGTEPSKILECARSMINKSDVWKNPFGDGKASEKIVGALFIAGNTQES